MNNKITSVITIGLYVYNGEKFLRERLDNILSQSYSNFELIVSDNCSTDSTSMICEEYSKKDLRIKYFRQKNTIDIQANGNFVLGKSSTQYFVWTQVDDIWDSKFLEKNIKILENNPDIVGCNSKVEIVGPITDMLKKSEHDTFFNAIYKKIRKSFRKMNTESLDGEYNHRLRKFLKNPGHNNMLFGVFKTKEFQQSVFSEMFVGNDFCIVMNLLKHGEMYVINEILNFKREGGMSGHGILSLVKYMKGGKLDYLFPHLALTKWCFSNLGGKNFVKNIDCFIKINLDAEFALFLNLIKFLFIESKIKVIYNK